MVRGIAVHQQTGAVFPSVHPVSALEQGQQLAKRRCAKIWAAIDDAVQRIPQVCNRSGDHRAHHAGVPFLAKALYQRDYGGIGEGLASQWPVAPDPAGKPVGAGIVDGLDGRSDACHLVCQAISMGMGSTGNGCRRRE